MYIIYEALSDFMSAKQIPVLVQSKAAHDSNFH